MIGSSVMRGEITFRILEAIGEIGTNAVDLFDVLISSGYGASYGKLQYELSRREWQRQKRNLRQEARNQLKTNYNKLIYKLKRDGLIKEHEEDNKKLLSLTSKGARAFSFLKNKKHDALPQANYPSKRGKKLIIVAFDIPEKESRKRWWLRSALKNLGFQMIQKSFWVGKTKIPEDFLNDLYGLEIVNFIEILEINKRGSLRQVE